MKRERRKFRYLKRGNGNELIHPPGVGGEIMGVWKGEKGEDVQLARLRWGIPNAKAEGDFADDFL